MLVSSGSSSSAKREDDGDKALARALGNLELREGLDNVYIGEQELVNMKKKARWLAVGQLHVHTRRSLLARKPSFRRCALCGG
jgi:hypothetical protein